MGKFTSFLSSAFLILLISQMLPSVIKMTKENYADLFDLKAKVGLISITSGIDSIEEYIINLKKFFQSNDIKAILLHIDSPGGAAGSSQSLFMEILSLKKENPKPVVVLTNDVCASGAYYIACAADYIICSPSALIGNVGAYTGSLKIKDLLEGWKIKYNIKQSGQYKTALNPFTNNTQEVEDFIQNVTDDVYKQFLNDVASRRKLSITQAEKWANGKFFTGKQALKIGLVDELGSEFNAEKKIRELAMIEKEKNISWINTSKRSKYEQLFESETATANFLDTLVEKICVKLGITENTKVMLK